MRICADLAFDDRRQNRYRTTLTHEYGHVHLHSYLHQQDGLGPSAAGHAQRNSHICKREKILTAPRGDWLEWQAGYACGALLMPISAVLNLARETAAKRNLPVATCFTGDARSEMIGATMEGFHVSEAAARVRLMKLAIIHP